MLYILLTKAEKIIIAALFSSKHLLLPRMFAGLLESRAPNPPPMQKRIEERVI